MQIFNTYFRLISRKKGLILVYVGIFILLSVFFTFFSQDDNTSEKYKRTSVNISIIDRDKSDLSQSIKGYLADKNKLVTIPDNEKRIQDELYWRNVEYVLIIPKNFEEQIEQKKKVKLLSKKIEDSANAVYVDEELKQFMSLLSLYQNAGYSLKDAIPYVEEDIKQGVKVTTVKKKNGESANQEVNSGYYYFLYLPYALVSIFILSVGCILIMFYQEDVRKRCICSSMKLKNQNRQLILANLIFCLCITILFIVIGLLVTKGELIGQINLLFYSINALAFMFVTIALGFLLGNLFHSETAINGCCNVFGLSFCFLGGVFVPLWVMPDSVVTIAHFVPTYWYVRANEKTAYMTEVTSSFLKEFFLNIGVELCFAVALFCVALMVSKRRRVFS